MHLDQATSKSLCLVSRENRLAFSNFWLISTLKSDFSLDLLFHRAEFWWSTRSVTSYGELSFASLAYSRGSTEIGPWWRRRCHSAWFSLTVQSWSTLQLVRCNCRAVLPKVVISKAILRSITSGKGLLWSNLSFYKAFRTCARFLTVCLEYYSENLNSVSTVVLLKQLGPNWAN